MGIFNFNKKSNEDTMLSLPEVNEPPVPVDGPEILNPFEDNTGDIPQNPEMGDNAGVPPTPEAVVPNSVDNNLPVPKMPTDSLIPEAPSPIEPLVAPPVSPMNDFSTEIQSDNGPADFAIPPSESKSNNLTIEDADIPEFPTFADKFGTKPDDNTPEIFSDNEEKSEPAFDALQFQEEQRQDSQETVELDHDIDSILGTSSGEDISDPVISNDVVQDVTGHQNENVGDESFGLFRSKEIDDKPKADVIPKESITENIPEEIVDSQSEEFASEDTNYVAPRTVSHDIVGPVYCSMDRCEDLTNNVVTVKETIKDLEKRIVLAVENEKELAKLYANWKKDIEFIQTRLFKVDKKIFA